MEKYLYKPLLLKIFILFLFFLPLGSLEMLAVPGGGGVGFSVHFARLFGLLLGVILFMNICLDIKYFNKVFRSGVYRNPYIPLFFFYILFSIVYYFILVALGQTVLFGAEESFFRNWQGRPFAQLLSFFTFGFIPFYIVKRYAERSDTRKLIERTFVAVILLLLWYGVFQQVSHALGFPVTGRNIFEIGRPITHTVGGVQLLRFYSLGGEPKQMGSFLVGAIFFYAYARYGAMTWRTKFNLLLMVVAFLLTLSMSAYVAMALALGVMLADILYRKRVRIRMKHVKDALIVGLIVWILVSVGFLYKFTERPRVYVESIVSTFGRPTEAYSLVATQSLDLVFLYYIVTIPERSPLYLVFGYGYANYLTPTVGLIQKYFKIDFLGEGTFPDSTSFLIKLVVEGGLVAVLLYGMIFLYTLRLNGKLLALWRSKHDREAYNKALFLRLAFIAFFVAGAVQTSYYYFIVMGIMIGKLNSVVKENTEDHATVAI